MLKLSDLIGLKITDAFFNEIIRLRGVQNGTEKEYQLIPEGDCCSESWIEHYELPSVGETIVNIIELEISNEEAITLHCLEENESNEIVDEEGREHECLQFYFYCILTDKGNYKIEMRNSSNGYYGGSLEVQEITND